MIELNTSLTVKDILDQVERAAINQTKDYLIDQARGLVGNVVGSFLKSVLPVSYIESPLPNVYKSAGNFEKFVVGSICSVFGTGFANLTDWLWLEPKVSPIDGEPLTTGYNCNNLLYNQEKSAGKYNGQQTLKGESFPDFIIKKTSPLNRADKGYLIGDVKYSITSLYNQYVPGANPKQYKPNQWQAISNYAKYTNGHMYAPITYFITYEYNKAKVATQLPALQALAIQAGVALLILNLKD